MVYYCGEIHYIHFAQCSPSHLCSDVGSRVFIWAGPLGSSASHLNNLLIVCQCMPPVMTGGGFTVLTLLIVPYRPTTVRQRLSYDRETHRRCIHVSFSSGWSTDRAAATIVTVKPRARSMVNLSITVWSKISILDNHSGISTMDAPFPEQASLTGTESMTALDLILIWECFHPRNKNESRQIRNSGGWVGWR